MENLLQSAGQYGALGLMLLACFYYIKSKDKDHAEERKEMNENFERQHSEALEVTKNNTNVLVEISTLIKNNK